jgi:polyisoprenoid-binding protein YceI
MPVSRKRLAFIAGAAVLAVTSPLVAQQAPGPFGVRDASRVTGGTYQVDSNHTLVRWEVDHLGITPYFGLFGDATGTLTLNPKNPQAAKVDITIPVAKVTTASPGLTAHLLKAPAKPGEKPDFFGPAPAAARFVSTAVTIDPDDPHKAMIAGDLTLNGVTRPVTLEATFHGAGKAPAGMGGAEQVGFKAEATIRRSDFGIGFAIPMVSDAVKLDIVAAFTR